jgi:hypothetical protein
MRKILCALSLTSALIFTLAVHAAAPTSFAGTWTLDKSKSQGLNRRHEGADKVEWVVAQTDAEITIEEKVTGGQMGGGGQGGGGGAPAGGAPAAGAGGGGGQGGGPGRGMGMGGPRSFKLDGSETTGEMGQGKFARKASWSNEGKTLELTAKSTFNGPNGEIVSTTTEKLSLSADGKTLTVNRHSESPRGAQDSTMVFTKQ